jgi:hypothetical protein
VIRRARNLWFRSIFGLTSAATVADSFDESTDWLRSRAKKPSALRPTGASPPPGEYSARVIKWSSLVRLYPSPWAHIDGWIARNPVFFAVG